MAPISFKILFPPSKDGELNKHIETACLDLKQKSGIEGFYWKHWQYLPYPQYDVQYPNVIESLLHVIAETDFPDAYNTLCHSWKRITRSFAPEDMPLLVLEEKPAFKCKMIHSHMGLCSDNICFGTLVKTGIFRYYSFISNGIISFNHNSRKLQMKFDLGNQVFFEKNLSLFDDFDLDLDDALDFELAYGMDFDLDFPVAQKYFLDISYNFIRRIYVDYINDYSAKIYFDLLHPPLLYKVEERYNKREKSSYTINHRTAEKDDSKRRTIGKTSVLSFKIGNLKEVNEIICRLHVCCKNLPICFGSIQDTYSSVPPDPKISSNHFPCNYLIHAIEHRNFYMAEQQRSYPPTIYLTNTYPECKPLEMALMTILYYVDSGFFFNFWQALRSLYLFYKIPAAQENFMKYIAPQNSRMIRRMVVTPTRLLFYPPEVMFENRVLRNFDSEYALRVSFRDDNFQKLNFEAKFADGHIFDYTIKNPMSQGIKIYDRKYEFLAWSNSQIRDHGVWMYARDSKGCNAASIRKWMGDFSHIPNVSKYMARMGQCFSQTVDTVSVPLESNRVRVENDIEGGRDPQYNPYCFSDGVGKISKALAEQVHNVMDGDKNCSAFQIRYGGCKGMLVIDPTLKDVDIVFRKSMKKFESPGNTRLEIAQRSSPSPLQLNRPLITLLDGMGVQTPVFLRLQEDMLKMLTDMLLFEKKAAHYLKSQTPLNVFKFKELSGSGVALTTEPFFRSLLLAVHSHHIDKIKNRANVAINPKDGRNMLGVLDETAMLEYGQVFVQYTTDLSFGETTKDTTIVKGTVLVTKNPCTHPGDVRKFTAVDVPALHHIVDCIVFPQRGRRPHPNEMAGSDLDGDEYVVIWKKDLIFQRRNEEPSDYPALSPPRLQRPISLSDMIGFLMDFIKNDQVGTIANAHLAIANEEGIFSPRSLTIAKKFSTAVDYAKNGVSAHLDINERPNRYPNFMEKPYKESFESKKALDKMFKVCKDFETDRHRVAYDYSQKQVDPGLIYPRWEIYKASAIQSRNKYNMLLHTIFQIYGVVHEAEAFSGAFSHLHTRFQGRKDRDEVEKIVIGSLKALCRNMKEEFFSEFSNIDETSSKMLQKASAWYMVTYEDENPLYISFPWIISGLLANIKIRSISMNAVPSIPPLIKRLDTVIQESDHLIPLPHETVQELQRYHALCNYTVLERALRVMMQWAVDMDIVKDPSRPRDRSFMFIRVFSRLVLHVALLEGYITSGSVIPSSSTNKEFSAATLCIEFLRFCVTLRFYNKAEVLQILPFEVLHYKKLSKQAIQSYHKLAITGIFDALAIDSHKSPDIWEMKPEHVHVDFFRNVPLERASQILIEKTGIQDIRLDLVRNTKKVTVYAEGTERSLEILKSLLRKKVDFQHALHS